MPEMKIEFISVLIATHNRCESLKETIKTLLGQEQDGTFEYEIIVVDNNSSDATKQVVEELMKGHPGKLKYAFESKQGKSFAINKGVGLSKGGIIACTDDDCLADPGWLKNIARAFREKDWDILCGKVIPVFQDPVPEWLDFSINIFQGPYVYFDLGENFLDHSQKKFFPPGANMIMKKKSYFVYGEYSLGTRAQDTEFCYSWSQKGAKFLYSPDVVIRHVTPKSRLNKDYIRKWHFLSGKNSSHIFTEDYHKGKKIFGVPGWEYKRFLRSIIRYGIGLFREPHKNFVNEIWVHFHWGVLNGLWGFKSRLENLR